MGSCLLLYQSTRDKCICIAYHLLYFIIRSNAMNYKMIIFHLVCYCPLYPFGFSDYEGSRGL